MFMFTTFPGCGVTSVPNALRDVVAQCRDKFISMRSFFSLLNLFENLQIGQNWYQTQALLKTSPKISRITCNYLIYSKLITENSWVLSTYLVILYILLPICIPVILVLFIICITRNSALKMQKYGEKGTVAEHLLINWSSLYASQFQLSYQPRVSDTSFRNYENILGQHKEIILFYLHAKKI